MIIYCAKDCENGAMHGIVCDGMLASDLDDEQFQELFLSDGTRCNVRQRGLSEIATNPTDAFSDSSISRSLEWAVQNGTDFEIGMGPSNLKGRFLCEKSRFMENKHTCEIELSTRQLSEFPTFIRGLESMRSFEEMLDGLDPTSGTATHKLAKLSDDLLSKANQATIWSGLLIPICFSTFEGTAFGVVELIETSRIEAIVRWVGSARHLAYGTELFSAVENYQGKRLATIR